MPKDLLSVDHISGLHCSNNELRSRSSLHRYRLFALSIGEETYYVVADLVGTPHFVVRGEGGEAFKRILRSPFGTLISETAEEFRVPIGFHGGIEDVSGSGAVLISGVNRKLIRIIQIQVQGGAGGLTHGWVHFDLDGPSVCPTTHNSAILSSAQAELGRQWNDHPICT